MACRRVVRQWRAISFVKRDGQGGNRRRHRVYSPDHTVVAAQISTRVEGTAAIAAAAVSFVQ